MEQVSDILLFAKQHKVALQNGVDFAQRNKFLLYEVNALHFLSIENAMELCRFLGVAIHKLEAIMNYPEYKYAIIKKKRGGYREIFAPERELKKIQKRLNYYLQAYYLWIKPEEVHGFVINPRLSNREKSHIISNAQAHIKKRHILNMDLKDFFPSISAKKTNELFLSPTFNFSEQIAIALTLLTTYEGKLPIGAPTSPVLSNFVCVNLDADLLDFCRMNDLQYTRYADDLTFSSDEFISDNTIMELKSLIHRNGFEINNKKLHLSASHQKQRVTGLIVNQKVNVDRKTQKKVRAMLYDLKKNGVEIATQRHFKLKNPPDEKTQDRFLCRLDGYITFIRYVKGE